MSGAAKKVAPFLLLVAQIAEQLTRSEGVADRRIRLTRTRDWYG
ncbi:hypothetical protein [Streptomyces sp. NPDC046862]